MAVVTSTQCLNAMRACLRISKDKESNKGGSIFTRYQQAMLNLHKHPRYAGIYEGSEEAAYVIKKLSDFQACLDSQKSVYAETESQAYAEELDIVSKR